MISRKVSVPTVLLALVGIVLVFTGDRDTGVTLLLAAAGVGGTGYRVRDPHRSVEPRRVGAGSDSLLPVDVHKQIRKGS